MKLVASCVSALFFAASASAINEVIPRHLQQSITCLLSGSDPASCCASASSSDQICNVINCADLNTGTLKDDANCSCSTLVDFCSSTATFLATMAPDVTGLCSAIEGCCGADTTNSDFNTCLQDSGADVSSLTGLMDEASTGGGETGSDAMGGMGDMNFPGMDAGMSMPGGQSFTDWVGDVSGSFSGTTTNSTPTESAEESDASTTEKLEESAPAPSPATSGGMIYGNTLAVAAAVAAATSAMIFV